MKTTKIIAIAIILGIVSLGYAQTESPTELAPDPDPQSIVIQLKKAMHNQALVKAMHAQLTPRFLEVDKPLYTVPVKYKYDLLYVAGTLSEWKRFFGADINETPQVAKSALIQLPDAMQIPGLVSAMRAQLTPGILQDDKEFYVAPVRYKHSIVYVGGTYAQWKNFFRVAISPNDTER